MLSKKEFLKMEQFRSLFNHASAAAHFSALSDLHKFKVKAQVADTAAMCLNAEAFQAFGEAVARMECDTDFVVQYTARKSEVAA